MARYAETTSVPVAKSRDEIEKILTRYGATAFAYGWNGDTAVIQFAARDRQIRFLLPMPDKTSETITHKRVNQSGWTTPRTPAEVEKAFEQAQRQAWRALALVIKAKLEAVEAGIVTFEDEFLAHVILPSGQTAGEWMAPQIDRAYSSGEMPPMLALGTGKR
jgi:hypothetical protein